MSVGLSPTWKVKTGSIGNLPTCDVLFSAKTVMLWSSEKATNFNWRDNPCYIPFQMASDGVNFGTAFIDDATNPWGFTRWLTPSTFKRGTLYVNDTSTWSFPFKVWLAEDGPVIDGGITGGPNKKKLMYHFLGTAHPDLVRTMTYDGPDVQMFSGHSYGYLFELDEPVPSLPTSQATPLVITMSSVIYFGGAGN